MRYVENGVREDFAKLTFKGLNVPLCELDEEEWLEVVFGIRAVEAMGRITQAAKVMLLA